MSESNWVRFTKRTDDPKLAYLEERLDALGIANRRNGHSFHAPILEVPEDKLDAACELLKEQIEIDGKSVRLDDVEDDHPMFQDAYEHALDAHEGIAHMRMRKENG